MKKERQIYIILSDTGTLLARMIRMYTKAPLNHASIAFDLELKEVYSFGRKFQGNPFIAGFVREDLRGELFKDATCAVYCCKVSDRHYRRIRSYIHHFDRKSHLYKYNLLGMIGILLNVHIKRDNAFFCSQFVASVFEQIGANLVPKSAAFTTPADFERSEALELMFYGNLRLFGRLTRHDLASYKGSAVTAGAELVREKQVLLAE